MTLKPGDVQARCEFKAGFVLRSRTPLAIEIEGGRRNALTSKLPIEPYRIKVVERITTNDPGGAGNRS